MQFFGGILFIPRLCPRRLDGTGPNVIIGHFEWFAGVYILPNRAKALYISSHICSNMPGRGRGRGRRRNPRWVSSVPETTFFSPVGVPPMSMRTMVLTVVEVEALRLVDLEGLTQEEAAMEMGISRRTFWNDLMSARRKVAFALVNGCAIRIAGGSYSIVGEINERDLGSPGPRRGQRRPMEER